MAKIQGNMITIRGVRYTLEDARRLGLVEPAGLVKVVATEAVSPRKKVAPPQVPAVEPEPVEELEAEPEADPVLEPEEGEVPDADADDAAVSSGPSGPEPKAPARAKRPASSGRATAGK